MNDRKLKYGNTYNYVVGCAAQKNAVQLNWILSFDQMRLSFGCHYLYTYIYTRTRVPSKPYCPYISFMVYDSDCVSEEKGCCTYIDVYIYYMIVLLQTPIVITYLFSHYGRPQVGHRYAARNTTIYGHIDRTIASPWNFVARQEKYRLTLFIL